MGKYIVAYDLKIPGKDYSQLIWVLKGYQHVKINDSVWVIQSSEGARGIVSKLRLYMDSNDSLFVCGLTRESAFANTESSIDIVKAFMEN